MTKLPVKVVNVQASQRHSKRDKDLQRVRGGIKAIEAQAREVHTGNSLTQGLVNDLRFGAIEYDLVSTHIELGSGYESSSDVCTVEDVGDHALLHSTTDIEKEWHTSHSHSKKCFIISNMYDDQ